MNQQTIDAILDTLTVHLQIIAKQQDDHVEVLADLAKEAMRIPWQAIEDMQARVKALEVQAERWRDMA